MEEIRIYHSIWKNIGLIATCFVFVAMGILMLLRGEQSFIAWTGILFFILFFGGGGLFVLFLILRERISHKAYYIITDESVGRTFRKLNELLAGVQESLPADGLNIKPQELCDLLNMRLTR